MLVTEERAAALQAEEAAERERLAGLWAAEEPERRARRAFRDLQHLGFSNEEVKAAVAGTISEGDVSWQLVNAATVRLIPKGDFEELSSTCCELGIQLD